MTEDATKFRAAVLKSLKDLTEGQKSILARLDALESAAEVEEKPEADDDDDDF